MGYYFDWIDERWEPIEHDRKLTPRQCRQITRRRTLLDNLLTEIEEGGQGVIGLYARLLARELVKSDEVLMREFGKRVAALSQEERVIQNQPSDRSGQ